MAVSVIPTLDLERAIAEQGYDVIVGFDEVGRGSLAGPVMVGAAAIWARDLDGPAGASQGGSQESSHLEVPKGVADSKMLTEHKREAIFDELKSWCASWAVGAASNKEIDEWGISHALGVAALRALAQAEAKLGIDGNGMLSGKPVKVGAILDGPNDYITKTLNTFDAPEVPVPANVTTKVKGDRYCAAVAAAAVIAKVTRDRLMVELGAQPQYEPYEWAHNKGYGSAAHRDAIAEFGPSDLHRLSWHLDETTAVFLPYPAEDVGAGDVGGNLRMMHAGRKPVSSSRRLMAGANPFPYRRKHGTHTSGDRSGHGLFDPTGDTKRHTHAGAQSRGFRHPGRRKHRGHGTVRFRQIDVTARTRRHHHPDSRQCDVSRCQPSAVERR